MYDVRNSLWHDVIENERNEFVLRYVEDANPYCSFAFKQSRSKLLQSRKRMSPLYRSYGYCTFKDCPVRFSVAVSNNGVQHLSLNVVFSTESVKHAYGEHQSRFVRSKRRKDLQEVLQHQSPSTVYNKLFNTITDTEFTSGKRDKVGRSRQVLQKISSEANLSKQRDSDLLKSLMLIREKMNENNSSKVGKYIQRINAFPLTVTCFTEEGVRLYHKLATKGTLYLDATGTIVSLRKTPFENRRMLYYALVMRHPKDCCGRVSDSRSYCSCHFALP